MRWFNQSNKSPIGIDIGSKYLRAVQLQRVSNTWHIEAATAVPRSTPDGPMDQEEAWRFAAMLDRQGFSGRDVVLAVPGDVLLGSILNLPPRESGAPLDQIAKMEMARIHRCEAESFEMASWDLPATGSKNDATQVMVSGCSHQDSDRLLDVFETAKLNVVALDTGAWSITRACLPLMTTVPNITAILDMGWGLGRLAVLYNGVIIYERTMPEAGVKLLSDALIKRTGLGVEMVDLLLLGTVPGLPNDQAVESSGYAGSLRVTVNAHVDAMIEDLKQSFSYALHRYPGETDQQLLLVGGGASIPGMSQGLADATGIAVRPINMSDLAQCPDDLTPLCNSPTFVKALGLAMHGMAPISND